MPLQEEKPPQWETCTPQGRKAPTLQKLEKGLQQHRPSTSKNTEKIFLKSRITEMKFHYRERGSKLDT